MLSVLDLGRSAATTKPPRPTTPITAIASAYDRPGVDVIPATRMVPAIAVPMEEPRFDTLRDRPEISPCSLSGQLDWTTFTDGVSIAPSPNPITNSPGANAQALGEPCTSGSSTAMPTTP